ncbi:MAG: DUF4402 domain-containing protein [Proteobacteria bacterium]|nr:DUF4402 domain-containing protein [Pseudomonadota bacterium]
MGALLHPVTAAATCQSVIISEVQRMDFATLETSSSPKDITVNYDGSGYTGSGVVLIGSPSRGGYQLVGDPTCTVSLDIENISTGSANVTLDSFKGSYQNLTINSFPSSVLPAPGAGSVLYLGAKMTYQNVPEGPISPTFDLVVNYQ